MHAFLGLGYITQNDILKFHPFACKIHDVLVFHSCVDVPHFFLSVLYFEGHLGCFQFLAIMNKTESVFVG